MHLIELIKGLFYISGLGVAIYLCVVSVQLLYGGICTLIEEAKTKEKVKCLWIGFVAITTGMWSLAIFITTTLEMFSIIGQGVDTFIYMIVSIASLVLLGVACDQYKEIN